MENLLLVLFLCVFVATLVIVIAKIDDYFTNRRVEKEINFHSKKSAKKRLEELPNDVYDCHMHGIYTLYDYVFWLNRNLYYEQHGCVRYLELSQSEIQKISHIMETIFQIDRIDITDYSIHSIMFDKELYDQLKIKHYIINYKGALDDRVFSFNCDELMLSAGMQAKVINVELPSISKRS